MVKCDSEAEIFLNNAQNAGDRARGTELRARGTGHRAQGTEHGAQGAGDSDWSCKSCKSCRSCKSLIMRHWLRWTLNT